MWQVQFVCYLHWIITQGIEKLHWTTSLSLYLKPVHDLNRYNIWNITVGIEVIHINLHSYPCYMWDIKLCIWSSEKGSGGSKRMITSFIIRLFRKNGQSFTGWSLLIFSYVTSVFFIFDAYLIRWQWRHMYLRCHVTSHIW